MLPGTTSSEAPFLAPRRLPGPGAALLARPCEAWEAGRWWVRGKNWEGRERSERHERQVVTNGEMRIRGGCMVIVQWVVDRRRKMHLGGSS